MTVPMAALLLVSVQASHDLHLPAMRLLPSHLHNDTGVTTSLLHTSPEIQTVVRWYTASNIFRSIRQPHFHIHKLYRHWIVPFAVPSQIPQDHYSPPAVQTNLPFSVISVYNLDPAHKLATRPVEELRGHAACDGGHPSHRLHKNLQPAHRRRFDSRNATCWC